MVAQKKMTEEKCKVCGKNCANCTCDSKGSCGSCGSGGCCCGKCRKGHCGRWIGRAFIALCFLVGLLGAGHFIGNGLKSGFHKEERTINVAVNVEKEVKADHVIWNVPFQATGTEIPALEEKYETDRDAIVSFLKDRGFKEEEMDIKGPTIEDQYASNNYGTDASKLPSSARYVMNSKIRVTTTNMSALVNAMKNTGMLVKKGVVLTQKSNSINPKYYLKNTAQLEKELYEEGMEKALRAAQEIASKAGVTLGSLRSLKQERPVTIAGERNTLDQWSHARGPQKILHLEIQAQYDIK